MQHLKNFTLYTPDTAEKIELAEEFAALALPGQRPCFCRDETGLDWYDAQSLFEQETIKIAYDFDGYIIDFSQDVSAIVPFDLSVIELNLSSIPAELSRDKSWVINDGEIKIAPVDYEALALANKTKLLSEAREKINILEDAVYYEIATTVDVENLKSWRIYRVLLDRVDVSNPEWPQVPE